MAISQHTTKACYFFWKTNGGKRKHRPRRVTFFGTPAKAEKEELNEMYLNKDKIGGFSSDSYWSSSDYVEEEYAWSLGFDVGRLYGSKKYVRLRVRAVRSF
jgi:hypothetical protein